MGRGRSPESIKAQEMFELGMKLVEIAKELDVPAGTVRRWKSTQDWEGERSEKPKANARKRGAPKGNKNGRQFKPGNEYAFKPGEANTNYRHALFAKYMPKESLDIIMQIESASPLDLIWDQIMIAYTAIQRSQHIMYVTDINDKTIEKIEERDGEKMSGEKWEVQQAWDKQANFLKAQARAQGELRSLVKQYKNMIDEHPELYTEEQRARIEKLKVEVSKAKGENNQEELDKLDKVLSEIKGVV